MTKSTDIFEMTVSDSENTMSEQQVQIEEQESIIRPEKFTPDWPPKPSQKPIPSVFTRCSNRKLRKLIDCYIQSLH